MTLNDIQGFAGDSMIVRNGGGDVTEGVHKFYFT